MDTTELLARAWIECDPNRDSSTADDPIGPMSDSNGNVRTTELTGEPRWHWFIPRAEALQGYLASHGFKIVLVDDQ